jgi:hypothetical protein
MPQRLFSLGKKLTFLGQGPGGREGDRESPNEEESADGEVKPRVAHRVPRVNRGPHQERDQDTKRKCDSQQ